ncbi:MAG: CoA transferase, partial [Burkholderiales bacterium]|nr:CoA transferase [Burkholderiales bacterium]
ARIENIVDLYQIVHEAMTGRTTEAWLRLLDAEGIPCGRVNRVEDLVNDPHLAASGFFKEMAHPTEGMLRVPSIPVRFRSHAGSVRSLGPSLGEHTAEVLRSLGYDDDEIGRLRPDGQP